MSSSSAAAPALAPQRLLSIQSHVVSGYVGNRCSTFPLQLLGWDVDVCNTTQLSNHTGYRRMGGCRLDAEHLQSVLQGLQQNGLVRYARLLTGYTPSPTALHVISQFIASLRQTHARKPIYLLDPVLGDTDRGYYVDRACLPLYRELMPLADIITPNSWEAEQLAARSITDRSSLLSVLATLHVTYGVRHVVLTSLERVPGDIGVAEGDMVQVGSSFDVDAARREGGEVQLQPWIIRFPHVEGHFVGVGDLFSALVLGRFEPNAPGVGITPLASAAELAIASVAGVLKHTVDAAANEAISAPQTQMSSEAPQSTAEQQAEAHVLYARTHELRLIQARQELERPQVSWRAAWLMPEHEGQIQVEVPERPQ